MTSERKLMIAKIATGWLAAVLVTESLHYGAGFDMGWWWVMFWVGVGAIAAWVKEF